MRELGRNRPQTIDELMDVVANHIAGEEAVGAFLYCEGGKGKSPDDNDEDPSRGPKKNKKKKKARLFQRKASTTILSPPWSAKGLDNPQRGLSSTKC